MHFDITKIFPRQLFVGENHILKCMAICLFGCSKHGSVVCVPVVGISVQLLVRR